MLLIFMHRFGRRCKKRNEKVENYTITGEILKMEEEKR